MRINLWEEFVKVWHLQMAKISLNMTRKFKITDFLLGFGFRSRRLFCRYCYVTWVYRFSYMYMKRSLRALRWISIGGAVEPFCHTYFWNTYSDVVQAWILIEYVKSGADRTLYGWVTTTFIPMARHRNLTGRHGHAPPMKTLDLRNLTSQRTLD